MTKYIIVSSTPKEHAAFLRGPRLAQAITDMQQYLRDQHKYDENSDRYSEAHEDASQQFYRILLYHDLLDGGDF